MKSLLEEYYEISLAIRKKIDSEKFDEVIEEINEMLDKREAICLELSKSSTIPESSLKTQIVNLDKEIIETFNSKMAIFSKNIGEITEKKKNMTTGKKAFVKYMNPYVNNSGHYFDKKK